MKVSADTLMDLLAMDELPDDFTIRLELSISKGELRRAVAARSGAPRDLSLPEMAGSVGRSLSTVRGWLADGLVPGGYKLNGRDWFCPPDDWAAYLETRKRPATPAAEAAPAPAPSLRPRAISLDSWRDVPARGGR